MSDFTAGAWRTRLRRRLPSRPADLDDDRIGCILEVAREFPRFTPEEVLAEIRYGRRRDDITAPMARYVLSIAPLDTD